MVNSVTLAALQANPVPSDRQCLTDATSVLKAVQDFVTVVGLASEVGGPGIVPTNNQAAQALQLAQQALDAVNALSARTPVYRGSASAQALPTGDSTQNLTWAPDLGTDQYILQVMLIGGTAHPTTYYGWRVVTGTQTSTGISFNVDNAPAGSSYSWLVSTIPNT